MSALYALHVCVLTLQDLRTQSTYIRLCLLLLYLLLFFELLVCIFKCMYVMAIIPQANHFVSLVAILAHMSDCISELLNLASYNTLCLTVQALKKI